MIAGQLQNYLKDRVDRLDVLRCFDAAASIRGDSYMKIVGGRNVRLRKIYTTSRACEAVASFLASTGKEEVLLAGFLEVLCSTSNRCLTSAQVSAFRRKANVAESTMFVLLTQLEKNEVIRKVPAGHNDREFLYYLHENFAKSLYRIVRAYRKYLLPARKPIERFHAPFLR